MRHKRLLAAPLAGICSTVATKLQLRKLAFHPSHLVVAGVSVTGSTAAQGVHVLGASVVTFDQIECTGNTLYGVGCVVLNQTIAAYQAQLPSLPKLKAVGNILLNSSSAVSIPTWTSSTGYPFIFTLNSPNINGNRVRSDWRELHCRLASGIAAAG